MLKEINKFRKRIMIGLTKNVGATRIDTTAGTSMSMKRILISRPNHRLGNLLLITPLLQEINSVFPDCKIDLFVKGGLAPILFENYDQVDRTIILPKKPFKELFKYINVWVSLKRHRYDLVINLDRASSSGRLSTSFVTAKNKFFGEYIEELAEKHSDYRHMAKNPVYNFRYFLSKMGVKSNAAIVPTLNLKLTDAEIKDGQMLLNELVPDSKKTIALFTYATGSKCYTEDWWGKFYKKLVNAFPDYDFIEILPVENISKINFKAPSFYSKDVREIAAVIANTSVFVGADSGIMHLAVSSQTPTVGLFSVTDPSKYEPYGNGSIAIDTNKLNYDQSIAEIRKILETGELGLVQYA
ncbi:glycosyltransferase family 9 protein [Flavobacterium sp. DG1-102-2]|uniref:glycosyltransferase family 9 protein n=1 Tax=Flavobacterium sp. DG1-102-2 TaxID=3081663 RepID=UPI00294A1659|nr:glycosyltransferase family 9 protein [Flavobacterium sp. DG1-102-2]MDV6168959.1 glycosyltransferase family 9 protein [Flavobacterium sp. DG1-102-2]